MFDETTQTTRISLPKITNEQLALFKLGQIYGLMEKYKFFSDRSISELQKEISSNKGIKVIIKFGGLICSLCRTVLYE